MQLRARHAILLLCNAPALAAAQSGGGESALARAEANPIGRLQSVPIELTSESGGALDGQASNTVTFKPVVPTDIGGGMMLVIRTLVPFDNVPGSSDSTRATGMGDINPQFYFTRAHPASVRWGFGPGFSLPTATNPSTRTGDWGLGPVAAAMWQPNKHFSIGAIATQLWTIAHDDDGEELDEFTIQPLLHWHFAHGYSLSATPTMKAKWKESQVWTVPLGGGLTKVTTFGRQPVKLGAEFYRYVTHPSSSGNTQLKLTVSFLFPQPARR
jgi:Putative MetA-pathway of phenol degradation